MKGLDWLGILVPMVGLLKVQRSNAGRALGWAGRVRAQGLGFRD